MPLDLITVGISFIILIYSVILHEIAHGLLAERLGDPTAQRAGRLTLNPIPHIDPIMTIALPLALYFLPLFLGQRSGFIFGAAKPVPVNPMYFKDPKKDMALVAMAGIGTNFLLAIIGALLYHVVGNVTPMVESSLYWLIYINLLLGVFNFIPIPPLDGSRVLAAALPKPYSQMLLSLEPYGFFIIFAILFLGGFNAFVYPIIELLMALLGIR